MKFFKGSSTKNTAQRKFVKDNTTASYVTAQKTKVKKQQMHQVVSPPLLPAVQKQNAEAAKMRMEKSQRDDAYDDNDDMDSYIAPEPVDYAPAVVVRKPKSPQAGQKQSQQKEQVEEREQQEETRDDGNIKVDPKPDTKTDQDKSKAVVDKTPAVNVDSPKTVHANKDLQVASSSVTMGDSEAEASNETYARMKCAPLPNPEALITSHLVHWKFAAEQGSAALRIPAVISAAGLMVTTVVPFFMDFWALTLGNGILSAFVFCLGILICVLDGRFSHDRNPLGFRAKLRNMVSRHLNVLRLVWGRGFLYITAGLLNIAHEWLICYVSGGIMILIGIIAVTVGSRASRNLTNLRGSLTDEEYLYSEFKRHDKTGMGSLTPDQFAHFIWNLGLEFDDVYTLRAFNAVDVRQRGKVTFPQFKAWWNQFKLQPLDDQSSYQHMV